jgi:ADP-heptose:LPS heptosyltransferase
LPEIPFTSSSPNDGSLLLFPFGSTRTREWRVENWRETLLLILQKHTFRNIEIWTPPSQRGKVESFARKLGALPLPIEIKIGNFEDLSHAISSAKLNLSVETFTAHLATALDARMVALLGCWQLNDFAPWQLSEKQQWGRLPLSCSNCRFNCPWNELKCIALITPAAIAAAAEKIPLK